MNYGLFFILLGFLGVVGLNNKAILASVWPNLVKQASLGFSVLCLFLVLG
jgi:hypothetical protein